MIYDYKDGIFGVDSYYAGLHGRTMVYIIVSGGRAAIIDTANNAAIKPMMDALNELGLRSSDIDYICLTHVHLDHAGGAGLFMESFPNAKLVVQKRGAWHMANPEKLIAGVQAVYGKEISDSLYGKLTPVPEERIISPDDGGEISFGGRTLCCLETPGHAKHHIIFHDPAARALFSGDAFGIMYRDPQGGRANGAIISTSPTQFDPQAMHSSIDRIKQLEPERVYLTHFGELTDVDRTAENLHSMTDAHTEIALSCKGDFAKIHEGLKKLLREEALIQDWACKGEAVNALFKVETKLSAKGLQTWHKDLLN